MFWTELIWLTGAHHAALSLLSMLEGENPPWTEIKTVKYIKH